MGEQSYNSKARNIAYKKTYVTGSSNASKGLLYIYDIFGYFPQSIQGADILPTSDKDNQYQVFIPDWFEGKPADISWYPLDNDEKGKALGNFFQTTGAPPATASKVPTIVEALTKAYPSIKTWGVVGFCWGGKIVSLTTSTSSTPFKAAAECHPAMVDPPKPKASRSLFACWPVMMNSRSMLRFSEIRFMAGWLRVRIWRMRGLRASMREDIRRCWSSLRSICEC